MSNPYPGLRPFAEAEHDVFFGRDEEVDIVLHRLAERRLLGVLGVSGCGKSSLVRAGLIPLLRSGLADPLEGSWTIVEACPGDAPWAALESATATALPRRSHALRDWARSRGGQILLLVDQFEEIFDFRRASLDKDGGNEAALFVDALLAAVPQMHIVFTMRTDFLGECAVFRGLAEALNDGHYLVPRMTRLQQQDAIAKPALAQGSLPQPALIQRLLRDAEDDPDKLPVLQHLLRKMWEEGRLDLETYERVGGWPHALERDAEAVLAQFPGEEEAIGRIFQWLTEQRGAGEKPIRKRRPVAELAGIAGISAERVDRILAAFGGRDFLRLEGGRADLMHESVMWQWPRLRLWIAEESADAGRLHFYHEAAGKKLALTGATLEEAQGLVRRVESPWAARYLDATERRKTLDWIAESARREQDEIARLRRARRRLGLALGGALLGVVAIGGLWWKARSATEEAERQAALANTNARKAEESARVADAERDKALKARADESRARSDAEAAQTETGRTARELESQLAQNHWQNSRLARDQGHDTEALHLAAEAIRRRPQMLQTVLLDMRALQPVPELRQVLRRPAQVRGAEFSRDESRILVFGDDGIAGLWDARSAQFVGPTLTHNDRVDGAKFNRDESRILTWSSDGTARLWNTRTGQQVSLALRQTGMRGADFNRDESLILTWSGERTVRSDNSARLWNAQTGLPLGHVVLAHQGPVLGASFSPDESRILTWSEDKSARLWDARSGEPTCPPFNHNDLIGARFDPSGSRFVTWGFDKTAKLWEVRSCQSIRAPLAHQGAVTGAVFNGDGSRVLTWSLDGTARLWDARTSRPVGPHLAHQDWVNGAVFNGNESRILTWSGRSLSKRSEARLWDSRSGQAVGSAMVHSGRVRGARFNADETRIVTWSDDKTARTWDAHTGRQIGSALAHEDEVWGVQLSRDGSRVLSWNKGGTVYLWDTRVDRSAGPSMSHLGTILGGQLNRDESRVLTWSTSMARVWDALSAVGAELTHENAIRGAVFSREGSRILSWTGNPRRPRQGEVQLWDVRSYKPIAILNHRSPVLGAEFSRNELRVLAWSQDSVARIWDIRTGQPMVTFSDALGARLSRDASRILIWSPFRTARLWDSRTGKALSPILRHARTVTGAELSNDESRILTWGGDFGASSDAILWDVRTGRPLGPAMHHFGPIGGAKLSHDESRILTWGSDKTARLWNPLSGQPITPALAHRNGVLGAQFSPDESRVLTWGGSSFGTGGEVRLWDATTGQQLGQTFEFAESVPAAEITLDEARIFIVHGNEARIWHLDADLDFPAQHIQLWLQAVTATEYDFTTRQVKIIEPERWRQLKQRYRQIAIEHARVCRYRDSNHWLRFHGDEGLKQ